MVVTLSISIPVCITPVVKASYPIKMPYFPYWPTHNGCQLINSNKTHGWDDISIAFPHKVIFDTALKSGTYPEKMKIKLTLGCFLDICKAVDRIWYEVIV